MTTLLILAGLWYAIYLDAKTFKRQNEVLYLEKIKLSPLSWVFLSAALVVAILPVYLLRRAQFKRALKEYQKTSFPEKADSGFGDRYLLTDATGIIITWFFIVVLIAIIAEGLSLLFLNFATKLDELVASAVLYSFVMIILIYHATRRPPYKGFLTSVGFRKGNQSLFKIILIPMMVGLILALMVSYIMITRRTAPSTPLSRTLESTSSPWALVSFFGMAILVAPLFEELVFRGYFFSVIKEFKGTIFVVCFIAMSFALLHFGQYWGDWLAILVVTLLGFSLTFLRAWSGSTITSVVTHYTYNFLITVIPIGMFIFNNPFYFKYITFYNELDPVKKEELLKESIRRQPHYMDAYNDLAWLYAEGNKNLKEALSLVEKALARDPQNYAYLDTKAEVLYRLKHPREALKIEEDVVRKAPSDPFFKKQVEKFKEALGKERQTTY